jgi:XTP/dITP diphosphohydrolase
MNGGQNRRLIVATGNRHKVEEIAAILGPEWSVRPQSDFPNAPAAVEDGHSFAENATKKALCLARWLASTSFARTDAGNLWVLADDSGLEVDALQGAPGIHSARFAAMDDPSGRNARDVDNNAKLLRLMADVPDSQRGARFRCVLSLTDVSVCDRVEARPPCELDEMEFSTEIFAGVCEGRITRTPSGAGGFGYDPLFVPAGYSVSFAELGDEVKNQISHRARALQKFRKRWAGAGA